MDNEFDHPFWVAKILEIMKNEISNELKSIVVHWYRTSSPDAFTRKYSLEMVKDVKGTRKKQRRKNVPTYQLSHLIPLISLCMTSLEPK